MSQSNSFKRVVPALGAIITLVVVLFSLSARPAAAAAIIVDSLSDTTAGDGFCTLREAIYNANDDAPTFPDCAAGSGADTITFSSPGTITLVGSQLPTINSEITITGFGPKSDGTIIQAAVAPNTANWRVFQVNTSATLRLNNLTVQHGRCNGTCLSTVGGGGGILNSGTLVINDSTIRDNSAGGGGGLYSLAATTTLNRTTFTGNSATLGGGIQTAVGTLTAVNSTISGNTAIDEGGGMYTVRGTLNVINSTFTNNTADRGGGINVLEGTLTLSRSIVSGNVAPTSGEEIANVAGTATGDNYNVLGHSTQSQAAAFSGFTPGGTDVVATGDGTNTTALSQILDPLADNGGPTHTHALVVPSSPAINIAPAADCAAGPVNSLDQRGELRTRDVAGVGNDVPPNQCDTGAYEVQIARLTINKNTEPVGGTGFPFIINPTNYSYSFQFGSPGIAPFQFNEPTDVAFDSDGNVYIADLGNFRVKKHQPDGTYITAWGSPGVPDSAAGSFNLPYGIAIDASDNVYVSDMLNSRVQKFDSNGTFLLMWGWGVDDGTAVFQTCTSDCQAGIAGNGAGQFNQPWGIGTDAAGNVYVSELGNDRIQKFSGNGTLLTTWGSTGTAEGQFDQPAHLAADATGNVYIADTGNDRVQKFDSNGNFLLMWGWGVDDGSNVFQVCTGGCQTGIFGGGDGQFFNVMGIEVDAAGNVYTSEYSNHRVQKFTPDGTFLTTFGELGTGDGQFNAPIGLGVNAEGTVYVADSFNDRIQVFTPDLAFTLDDLQSESFYLDPGVVWVSELVPDGWKLEDIVCSTISRLADGTAATAGATRELLLSPGDDLRCRFRNSRPPSFCPVDANVGNEMTDLIGTGQGSPIKGLRTRKLVVPNSDEVVALYGQLAAVDVGVMKYVRFLPQGEPKVQIHAPTSPAYRPHAVDWWGTDLPTDVDWVKGQFFWGAKANKAPRAFVLWPTYETAEPYANVFVKFDESTENHVAMEPGWIHSQLQTVAIPETQAAGADVTVKVALVDVDQDGRVVVLRVRAGSASEERTIMLPNSKDLLNLETFNLTGVEAGVDEVVIELITVAVTADFPDGGDSAAIIGAAVSYPCDIPVR